MKKKKNLLDFFSYRRLERSPVIKKLKGNHPIHKQSETPPTPATPCTPLTPQTPASSSCSRDSSSSSTSSSGTKYETPLTTPQTPATPASSQRSQKETQEYDVIDIKITTTRITKKKEDAYKKKHQHRQQQLYLDFGQASFGSRSICPICHTLVVHGITEDEIQHNKICKEFQLGVGVPLTLMKNFRMVPNSSSGHLRNNNNDREGCIVEVRPTDCLTWRRKVMQVQNIVEQELGFVRGGGVLSRSDGSLEIGKRKKEPMGTSNSRKDYEIAHDTDNDDGGVGGSSRFSLGNKTIYLYIINQRVVGFCSVEVISQAFEMYLHFNKSMEPSTTAHTKYNNKNMENGYCDGGTITRSMKPSKAILGVHQLWCHKLHRQKGIASQLVDAARLKCIFGMTVPACKVAFSSPTWDGARFAKKYSHPHVPLVYEL
jgi:N-acetyltransferase